MQLIWGFQTSQIVATMLRLRLDLALAGGSSHVAELARATGADAGALARFLRAAAAVGLVRETERDRFEPTAAGAELHAGREALAFFGDPALYLLHSRLSDAVVQGGPVDYDVLGGTLWEHLRRHPESQADFDRMMAAATRAVAGAIVQRCDLSRFHRIVDVGGGAGATLAALLRAAPGASGVLLDQPHVVAGARDVLAAEGVDDRVELAGGSFLDGVPAGGDLYVVKSVLQNWDDEDAGLILRRCAEAAPAGARLLLVDQVLPDSLEPSLVHLFDLLCLVAYGGRVRTLEQFRALLDLAGWRVDSASEIDGHGQPPFILVEARLR
jgi:hypothetical protein